MDNNRTQQQKSPVNSLAIALGVATVAGMVVTAGGIFAASFGSAAVGLPIMIAGAATVGAAAVVAGVSLAVDGLKNKNNKVGPQEDVAEEVERGLKSKQGLGLAQEMVQTRANSRSRPVTPTSAQNVAGRGPRSVSDYDSSSEHSTTSTTEGERNL